jgi:hypothetical protein
MKTINQKIDEFYWYSKRNHAVSNGAKGFMGPPKYRDAV